MHHSAYDWLPRSLETLHKANWYRQVNLVDRPGPLITKDGQQLINFASNDYLGLASDERLSQAAISATRRYGTGSTGSRLLSGHRELHVELEHQLADLKQTEAALVFSSGYLANLGTIAALVGPKDFVLSDIYNHSSLKNGAKLSGATLQDYRHCDINDLAEKLAVRDRYRRCLILTDTVFSMDGDLCPLPAILDLAEYYNCMVLVDEAHATGVFGAYGSGVVEQLHCLSRSVIQVGTLSKALGSLGGFVAGSADLIDFLRNRASTWVYTTGLSPADSAAAIAALKIIRTEPAHRQILWHNLQRCQTLLNRVDPLTSPIFTVPANNPTQAIEHSRSLEERGIWAPAVRPPTVPTSRLRLTLMATHTSEQLEKLAVEIKNLTPAHSN
ncbi:MAG: 8-amino-7-oxononanoate synthase [Cyanobacteria bacterium P01_H01_bin.15]